MISAGVEQSGRVEPRQENVFDVIGVDAPVAGYESTQRARLSGAGNSGGDDCRAAASGYPGLLGTVLLGNLSDEPLVSEVIAHRTWWHSKLPSVEEGGKLGVDVVTESVVRRRHRHSRIPRR